MRYLCYFSLAFSLFVQTPEAETLLTSTDALVMSMGHGAVDVVQGRSSVDISVRGEGEFTFELIRLVDRLPVDSVEGKSYGSFRYSKLELGSGVYLVRAFFDGKPIEAYFWVEA